MATITKLYADNSGKGHSSLDEAVANDLVLAGAISNIVFAREVVKNRKQIMDLLESYERLEEA